MNAELDLTEATAALGRLALGANYAHDVRLLRLVLERLKALSSPPADDVREAVAKRIADEVEYRVRTAVTLAMNGHEYEQHVTQGRESVAAILDEVRPYGTVTDAVSDDLLLESRTIRHARYGGLGGDVTSLTITAEAWRRLGEPHAVQVSTSASAGDGS